MSFLTLHHSIMSSFQLAVSVVIFHSTGIFLSAFSYVHSLSSNSVMLLSNSLVFISSSSFSWNRISGSGIAKLLSNLNRCSAFVCGTHSLSAISLHDRCDVNFLFLNSDFSFSVSTSYFLTLTIVGISTTFGSL